MFPVVRTVMESISPFVFMVNENVGDTEGELSTPTRGKQYPWFTIVTPVTLPEDIADVPVALI
jgi:hypothetical protein